MLSFATLKIPHIYTQNFSIMSNPTLDVLATDHVVTSKPSTKTKAKPKMMAYRFMIFYRFLLAALGGYVLASLAAIVIAQSFSESGTSAAMSATLIGFTLQACAFIWVFMVNKTLKASLGIVIPSVLLYIIYRLLGQ